ncbi:hypothetical protein, partial [Ectopseudomonas composti]|uniref:hypothetical protein n=1 Tax=Ectopseudomonas composti TaxID=658457 RepID=UPI0019D6FA93
QVAELVDALVSGISDLTVVEVRVFSWAPKFKKPSRMARFFIARKKALHLVGCVARTAKTIEQQGAHSAP